MSDASNVTFTLEPEEVFKYHDRLWTGATIKIHEITITPQGFILRGWRLNHDHQTTDWRTSHVLQDVVADTPLMGEALRAKVVGALAECAKDEAAAPPPLSA